MLLSVGIFVLSTLRFSISRGLMKGSHPFLVCMADFIHRNRQPSVHLQTLNQLFEIGKSITATSTAIYPSNSLAPALASCLSPSRTPDIFLRGHTLRECFCVDFVMENQPQNRLCTDALNDVTMIETVNVSM
jgi:hypothetical protein